MHELSLCEDMMALITEKVSVEGAQKVTTVWLEVGQLSHVEADAMAFCFDAISQGTAAQGAKLELIKTPGQGQCNHCKQISGISNLYDPCPHCGEFGWEVQAGMDVKLKKLEIC